MSNVKVYGNYVRYDEMSWPRVGSELNWKLRYAQEQLTKEDLLAAATIIGSYDALVFKTQKERNKICNVLRNTVKEDENEGS